MIKTKNFLSSAVALLIGTSLAFSQRGEMVGKPINLGGPAAKMTTAELMKLAKLEVPRKWQEPKRTEIESDRENLLNAPGALPVASWPNFNTVQPTKPDSYISVPLKGGIGAPPRSGPLFSLGLSFGGPDLSEAPAVPPDSTGDVSPSSVIIAANGRIRSYSRTGVAGALNMSDSTFFNAVRGTSGMSDPRVIFDRTSQRWFIEEITTSQVSSNNRFCLAVSSGEAITATTTWTYYSFVQNVGGGTNGFADYATLGVDVNAVYIGDNKFNSALNAFLGCDFFVLRKAPLLVGGALVVTPFRLISPASGAGIYTPWGCTNDDPSSTTGLVVGVDNAAFGLLKARRVITPGGTPTLSAELSVTVPTTANAADSPISISATATGSIDTLDDRLFYARIHLNRVTRERTLWTAHNIGVSTAGFAVGGGRSAGRFYQLNNLFSGTLSLVQAGTAFDSASTNPVFNSIPSIAMNGLGHAFMGFTRANTLISPSVGGAFRLSGDTLGVIGAGTTLIPGANYYNVQSQANGKRWGDYSTTVVDPRDGMSIWSFQEYCNVPGSWRVGAVKMLSPAPTVTSITPSSVTQGASNVNLVVTGTGIFDPDPSYPDHLAITIPNGVTVNSVTWNSPTQATVNVSVAEAAPVGARVVTLTNPDGQATTGSLTINQLVKTVSGLMVIDDYVGPMSSLLYTVELRDVTSNALLQTATITGLSGSAGYTINTTLLSGTYKMRVKAPFRFLGASQNITLGLTGATNVNFLMINGDVDGNNSVGNNDVKLIKDALGSTPSSENWNPNADLNGDGAVTKDDREIWRTNFGQVGV